MLGAFEFPPLGHLFEWPDIAFEDTPFAINKVVLCIFASSVLVVSFFTIAASRSRQGSHVPKGIQNLAEAGLEVVEKNISLEVMGPHGRHFTPFLAALFYWILFMNVFGLLPVIQLPAASRMALPGFLALMVYALMWFYGFKAQGPRYITNSIFPPGVPKFLYLLVTPIEFVSKFLVRPFSHAVRLFANLMAGHILLTTFALLTAALWIGKWNAIFLPLPFAMGVAMTAFEVLVAALQAYIFTILAAVYLNESLHPDH